MKKVNEVKKRISSKDVAKMANVSQSTVSRVFSKNSHLVSDEKRQKVIDVGKELGYRPSIIARSLSKSSTKIIGLVIRDFDNPFYIKALDCFTDYLQKHDYSVMLFNIGQTSDVENNIQIALEYQVAGLIITSARLSSPFVERCSKFNTPVFMFNRVSEGLELNSVCCKNFEGGEKIASYLIDNGSSKLLYVSGDKDSSTNQDKQNGFISAAKKRGVENVKILEGVFSYDSGFKAGKKLVESKMDIDGVFCGSDNLAMGFYDYIKHYSDLKIPRDLSIVGFDGVVDNINYPITTYKQPLELMVRKTCDFMLSEIENYSNTPIHLGFSGEIIEKGSVKDRSK